MISDNEQSGYRWYILTLGVVTHVFVASMPMFCMPVLFKEMSQDLGMDLVQVGVVWGLVNLPQLFAAFAAGLISDKFGATRTLGVSAILTAVAGALRGASGDYVMLAVTTFLFGLFFIPLSLATHKAAGEWFSEKQLGMANGILAGGFGVGNMLGALLSATVLSPLLGGWRNVMFVFGVVAVVVGILWFLAQRSPTSTGMSHLPDTVPFRQALSQVVRVKAVWVLAMFLMGVGAYSFGLLGYLPLFLASNGWPQAVADSAQAAFGAASVVAVIPLCLLSDRIGRRKLVVYIGLALVISGISLLTAFGGGAVWVGVVLTGLYQEAFFAITITMLIETNGVGPAYSGTALGLALMFYGLGAFFSPPLGNSLAQIEPRLALGFWLALAVGTLIVFLFATETGWKKDKRTSGGDSD